MEAGRVLRQDGSCLWYNKTANTYKRQAMISVGMNGTSLLDRKVVRKMNSLLAALNKSEYRQIFRVKRRRRKRKMFPALREIEK
jgi:hypothetical protein